MYTFLVPTKECVNTLFLSQTAKIKISILEDILDLFKAVCIDYDS